MPRERWSMKDPKKEINRAHSTEFVTVAPHDASSELAIVVCYLKRVRHNLFHGGKAGDGVGPQMDRNHALLATGATVINELMVVGGL